MIPKLDSPASVRRFLMAVAAGSVVVLIYASLVPLQYTPLPWKETYEQWRHIPWLTLDLFNRADWVANALVVLPSGILAAAAIDWGRPRRWPLLVAVPIITIVLACVVVGIELLQIWFPPRTVSMNDIVAGYVGAVIGPLIWVVAGPDIEYGVTRFLTLPRLQDRLMWLCLGYLAFIVVYSILPLDLVLTREEWKMRFAEGNIRFNPFHGEGAAVHAIKGTLLGALRMGPVGLVLALSGRRRLAAWTLILLPVALELLQLPIFSKFVTTMEVVGGWLGGAIGYVIGAHIHRFERILRRPSLWGLAWIVTLAVTLAALLSRHDQILHDHAQIAQRYSEFWALPLVKYYSGSEYNALTNALLKFALFGALGGLAFGWQKTSSRLAAAVVFSLTLLTVLIVAPAIELLQIILPPLVPDVSDILTYWLGYVVGYQLMRILWGAAPAAMPRRQLARRPRALR